MDVVLERAGMEESRHRIHVAVVDETGRMRARSGDPHLETFVRSAAKPFQALPLIEDGVVERWGLSAPELAICCGSHGGEAAHIRCVRALYRHVGHPVQQRMLAEVARWTGVSEEEVGLGVDGCGVACFRLPISAMATAYGRLAQAAASEDGAAGAVMRAMGRHPFMVAGTGRLCTELMLSTEGRIVAKVGAEGVYCAAGRTQGHRLALKVEDGGRRGAEVALVSVLTQLGFLTDHEMIRLKTWRERVVPNTLGEAAAVLRSRGWLEEVE